MMLAPPAVANAKAEAAEQQKIVDQEKGGFQIAAWDWDFYSEKVRKAKYDFDESQLRPYYELNHVLVDGVFFAAGKLYGLTFKERHDLPVYQPDVRVFDVFDKDGKQLRPSSEDQPIRNDIGFDHLLAGEQNIRQFDRQPLIARRTIHARQR